MKVACNFRSWMVQGILTQSVIIWYSSPLIVDLSPEKVGGTLHVNITTSPSSEVVYVLSLTHCSAGGEGDPVWRQKS